MKEEEKVQKRYGEGREEKIRINRQYIKHEGFIEGKNYKHRKTETEREIYSNITIATSPSLSR